MTCMFHFLLYWPFRTKAGIDDLKDRSDQGQRDTRFVFFNVCSVKWSNSPIYFTLLPTLARFCDCPSSSLRPTTYKRNTYISSTRTKPLKLKYTYGLQVTTKSQHVWRVLVCALRHTQHVDQLCPKSRACVSKP